MKIPTVRVLLYIRKLKLKSKSLFLVKAWKTLLLVHGTPEPRIEPFGCILIQAILGNQQKKNQISPEKKFEVVREKWPTKANMVPNFSIFLTKL